MQNFWQKLPHPFFVLAPMADVTDAAFRRIIAKYGKPDVMFTEFVSADGLVRANGAGKKKLLKDLEYTEAERPIVAQLFSAKPEYMREAAKLVRELGFDGLDINMGCPDRGVEKQGAGAALMKNPKLAREIIRAAKKGFEGPVSVKTRIGYNTDQLDTWLPEILKEGVVAVAIHARTRKEMSKVPARWEAISRAVKIRDEVAPETLIIGNGDVKDLAHARELARETGADGVMLGRAIFGNPWLFSEYTPTAEEKLKVLVEHTKLFDELMRPVKNFSIMKKHFKSYVSGFPAYAGRDEAGGSPVGLRPRELREKLMQTNNAQDVDSVVAEFFKSGIIM